MDVSDRRMQVQLTQEAKIASHFPYIRAIFAVVGFVSALTAPTFREGGASIRDGGGSFQRSAPATAMLASVHTPSVRRKP